MHVTLAAMTVEQEYARLNAMDRDALLDQLANRLDLTGPGRQFESVFNRISRMLPAETLPQRVKQALIQCVLSIGPHDSSKTVNRKLEKLLGKMKLRSVSDNQQYAWNPDARQHNKIVRNDTLVAPPIVN